jgi:hypothetical protein
MRGQSARFLVRALGLLVLISLILAMVGCGGDSGGGGGDKDAIAIMKKLPKGTDSFMFMDMKTMRTDDDLKDLYDTFSQDSGDMTMMGGMSMEDVDFFAMGDQVFIMEGTFDLAELRAALEEDGFEKDEYQGVEIWGAYGYTAVLVDNGCTIMASDTDAEDCIDAIKGKSDSLYEDEDVADDMSKLPGDSLVVVWGGGSESLLTDEGYSGLEATGISMSKKDADELQLTAMMRFKDAASAKDVMAEVKTDLEDSADAEVKNVKVNQDGQYIKATADMSIDEGLFD